MAFPPRDPREGAYRYKGQETKDSRSSATQGSTDTRRSRRGSRQGYVRAHSSTRPTPYTRHPDNSSSTRPGPSRRPIQERLSYRVPLQAREIVEAEAIAERMDKEDIYERLTPEEQLNYITHFLIPRGKYREAFAYLETMNRDFIERKFTFEEEHHHTNMKHSMKKCIDMLPSPERPENLHEQLKEMFSSASSHAQRFELFNRICTLQSPADRTFSPVEKLQLTPLKLQIIETLCQTDRRSKKPHWIAEAKKVTRLFKAPIYITATHSRHSARFVWPIIIRLFNMHLHHDALELIHEVERDHSFISPPAEKRLMKEMAGMKVFLEYCTSGHDHSKIQLLLRPRPFQHIFNTGKTTNYGSVLFLNSTFTDQSFLNSSSKTIENLITVAFMRQDYGITIRATENILQYSQGKSTRYITHFASLGILACCTALKRLSSTRHPILSEIQHLLPYFQGFIKSALESKNLFIPTQKHKLNPMLNPIEVFSGSLIATGRASGKNWLEIYEELHESRNKYHKEHQLHMNLTMAEIALTISQKALEEPYTPKEEMENSERHLRRAHELLTETIEATSAQQGESDFINARYCRILALYYQVKGSEGKGAKLEETKVNEENNKKFKKAQEFYEQSQKNRELATRDHPAFADLEDDQSYMNAFSDFDWLPRY